jgi:hypothetical protein
MKMDKGTVRAEVTLHRKRVVDGDKKGDLKERYTESFLHMDG